MLVILKGSEKFVYFNVNLTATPLLAASLTFTFNTLVSFKINIAHHDVHLVAVLYSVC